MADVRAFHGLRYNKSLIPNLGDLLCPPFDVISPAEQQDFYNKDPYNIIRLEHTRVLPEDTQKNNKYTRAAATLEQWLKEGVLVPEDKPALYVHQHYFTRQSHQLARTNLIACVRLEEWEKGIIKPHEFTRSAAKTDRLDLMRACRANFSLPMALYDDPDEQLADLLSTKGEPLEIADAGEEKHLVWSITGPDLIKRITGLMAQRTFYIADGHHRYETALNYRNEQRQANPKWTKDDSFNFIMLCLISTSDPGLLVLPTHRVVKGISPATINEIKARMESLFDVENVPLKQADYALNLMRKSDRAVIGLVGAEPLCFQVLSLRQDVSPAAQVSLIIRLLHRDILEGLVESSAVEYSSDAKEALARVGIGECQLAFILNAPSIEEIKAASDCGDRMPHKSTFFYPKPPTGLVIRRLEGKLLS